MHQLREAELNIFKKMVKLVIPYLIKECKFNLLNMFIGRYVLQ